MLSGAQHLQYLPENKLMQILRSAQDDRRGISDFALTHQSQMPFNSDS
jgi:hypothetical protein